MTKKEKKRKFWPPVWLRVVAALPLLLMLWVRFTDSGGDRGIVKVNSFFLGVLCLLILTPWFVFFSAYSRKFRFGLPLLAIVGVVGFFNLFEYQGVSGAMTPSFRWRFTSAAAGPSFEEPSARAGIDLATTTPDDFPAFLGARGAGKVEGVALAADWSVNAPQQVWKQPIGAGWSGFAVVNGVAVTMEEREGVEAVTAYDARTGELLWARRIGEPFGHVLGGSGPRGTPAIDEGRVYAIGVRGWVGALDGATGEVIWEKELTKELGVTVEQEDRNIAYGRSNSPLIDGHRLIVPGGGDAAGRLVSLIAYDKRTGEKLWEGGTRQISFASPRAATVAGVRQILSVQEDHLGGFDPETGRLLWEYPWPGKTSANASASQAVPVPPNRVFISKGYGGGGALIELSPQGDGTFSAAEIWKNGRVLRTKFTQVVRFGDHLYGLSDGILECAELATGKRVWKGGRYEHGQILGVGKHLVVLTEQGEIVLIDPTPDESNKVLGRFQAIEGQTWNNLALYGDLLLVRNGREAAAWRLPLAGPARAARRGHRQIQGKRPTASPPGAA